MCSYTYLVTGHRDVVHQTRSGFTSDSCGRVGTIGIRICTCDRWLHIVNFGNVVFSTDLAIELML